MSRKSQTIATFTLRVQVPAGGNCPVLALQIQQILLTEIGHFSPNIEVKLVKKETNYGN